MGTFVKKMSTFRQERTFNISVPDLAPVAEEAMQHFKDRQFQVEGVRVAGGGWHISIHKGGTFKAVIGMKTALNIDLQPERDATVVRAGIGIFGQQVVPALIARLVFWPVLVAQVWGLVKQAKLDDEAIEVIGNSLARNAVEGPETAPIGSTVAAVEQARASVGRADAQFCIACGQELLADATSCTNCGTAVTT